MKRWNFLLVILVLLTGCGQRASDSQGPAVSTQPNELPVLQQNKLFEKYTPSGDLKQKWVVPPNPSQTSKQQTAGDPPEMSQGRALD